MLAGVARIGAHPDRCIHLLQRKWERSAQGPGRVPPALATQKLGHAQVWSRKPGQTEKDSLETQEDKNIAYACTGGAPKRTAEPLSTATAGGQSSLPGEQTFLHVAEIGLGCLLAELFYLLHRLCLSAAQILHKVEIHRAQLWQQSLLKPGMCFHLQTSTGKDLTKSH